MRMLSHCALLSRSRKIYKRKIACDLVYREYLTYKFPRGSTWQSFHFELWWIKKNWVSICEGSSLVWKLSKSFTPQRDCAKAEPVWGPIDSLSILLWSKERCLTLSISKRKLAFLKSWKSFIPRRDSGEAESIWGPFDSLSILLWSSEGFLTPSI